MPQGTQILLREKDNQERHETQVNMTVQTTPLEDAPEDREKEKGDRRELDMISRRLSDISHKLSRLLRHKGIVGMRRGGFVNVQSLLDHPYIVERESSEQDVGGIVDGLCGNTKYRFEIGNPMWERRTWSERHKDTLPI